MFKFIHVADIHLDSPLMGLEYYEGAPVDEIRGASRRALENMVEFAIEEECAFVLIAGDLYDGEWKDYNTGLFFASQMTRLREAGIDVFVISGNHDAASQISRKLRLPDNVKVFGTRKAGSFEISGVETVVHGRGFETRAVTEDLSATYPDRVSGMFNIGILHTSLDGREGHDSYAPCTLQGLISKGYDYWALGHVHNREEVSIDPWVVFSGNIQGRHVRETGAKGCTLVTVEEGSVTNVTHHDLDVFRFSVCQVDVLGVATEDDFFERVAGAVREEMSHNPDKPLALRLNISGETIVHDELQRRRENILENVRSLVTDISGGIVWLEKLVINTSAENYNEDSPVIGIDALKQITAAIDGIKGDDELLDSLVREFSNLNVKLPEEFRNSLEGLDLSEKEVLLQAADDVKYMILGQLRQGREET